jgi:hypothetical protein
VNWTELLKSEIEHTYQGTENLLDRVEGDGLDWKPPTGSNWMTTGQLIMHITNACGSAFRGFVTGDWGMPEGVEVSELPPEEMVPPAERLPTASSVAEAKALLAEDKRLALDMLAQCSEDALANQATPAPWDPITLVLGYRLLQMVDHLRSHKAQLFYYLKLQGQAVNTGDLWGG